MTQLNTRLQAATAAYNTPGMSDTDKTQQMAELQNLQSQLRGAMRAMQDSSARAHAVVAGAGGSPVTPATDNRPPLASFGGAPAPAVPFNTQAGPRAVPPPSIPGFLNNGIGSP